MQSQMSKDRSNGVSHIQAVILDYGKVLARSPTPEEFGLMASKFDLSFEVFHKLWEAGRGPYDRGDLTAEEYWLNLAAQTHAALHHGEIDELRQIEVEIWCHLNSGMIDWVSQLRSAGIRTGLLSNMPGDLAAHLRTNCPCMENFTFKTFSAEVKLVKPDPAIYKHTLHGLGVSAAEALFVDDREPNVEAARELGIHSVQFQSIGQLSQDLKALAFPILPVAAESPSAV
jgi:putative hydrolase of the HAD superfamily